MKKLLFLCAVLLVVACSNKAPIHLHPQNSHYFEWKGKPTVLITSAEHYGAVLNLDFDFEPYFKTLAKDGLNLTRTFSGIYCEHPEAFNIAENTLAPKEGRLICPWKRSKEPGYANGGNKFDLTQWDENYFIRLKEFMRLAKKYNVVVEFVLFCPFYGDEQWALSPVNAKNNINDIGHAERTEVFTLNHEDLTNVQDDMVRKIVTELNVFDNLYYEICNEPYFAGPTLEWQAHISQIIKDTEEDLPQKHMIAQNIANNSAKIENPDPNIDLFNFHYANTSAVDNNYHLNKALGDDETGFDGTAIDPYRHEAWNFILAGGALFDHLDYSFTANHEDGKFKFPDTQPGSGGIKFRKQIGFLKKFVEKFDFINSSPAQNIISQIPDNINARILGTKSHNFIGYVSQKQTMKQHYSLRWEGKITPQFSETYTFYTVTDDGARLWVNGKKLVDDWTSHAPTENSGKIRLKAGVPVDIKMEFFQGAGGASSELLWASTSQPKTVIDRKHFNLPDGKAPGLELLWFSGTEFDQFKAKAVVFDASFDGNLGEIFTINNDTNKTEFTVNIPHGIYKLKWLDTKTGQVVQSRTLTHEKELFTLSVPQFKDGVAFSLVRN